MDCIHLYTRMRRKFKKINKQFLICLERTVKLSCTNSGAPHGGVLIALPRPVSVFQKQASLSLSLSLADATQLMRLIRMDVIC